LAIISYKFRSQARPIWRSAIALYRNGRGVDEYKFGASFSPELREAWRVLYAMVQAKMLREAAET
jgi:hypothetical protein